MKETIYTIPISEVFEPKEGCPLCRLHKILEERALDAIMGAAMMEPDIRKQTNQAGFCRAHYEKMLSRKNRLSLALMLESHLDEVMTLLPRERQDKVDVKKLREMLNRCYICEKVDASMDRMIRNLFEMYRREESFRQLYAQQPMLCVEHYCRIAEEARTGLGKKEQGAFLRVTAELAKKGLASVREDIGTFCASFDYRNAGKGVLTQEIKTAAERSVNMLTGE